MTRQKTYIYISVIFLLLGLIVTWYAASFWIYGIDPVKFDGERAYADVGAQVAFGPRTPGSAGHAEVQKWMRAELEKAGWMVEVQETAAMGHPLQNIIAKRSDAPPQIILGAHYDTRFFADKDPDPANQSKPVPGANDGASGVAVLIELARTFPQDTVPIWLVFFDAEDQGRFDGWDWILGSRAFVEELQSRPQAVVIVDMIGDADLNIYMEKNSDPTLRAEIWAAAAGLGHQDKFIPEEKYPMLDDHTPFLEAGIPAVDLIDFDYPYYHTMQDTPDKVSAQSLNIVGETLWTWVTAKKLQE
jgi:Zn-dependent M28 family amino/carboxypeptidase